MVCRPVGYQNHNHPLFRNYERYVCIFLHFGLHFGCLEYGELEFDVYHVHTNMLYSEVNNNTEAGLLKVGTSAAAEHVEKSPTYGSVSIGSARTCGFIFLRKRGGLPSDLLWCE